MMNTEKLIAAAVHAACNAYAPYSGFRVGAAVLCEDGNIYTGTNMENASFGATICAERAAVCAAVSAGCRRILAAAVAAGTSPVSPCGICRQVLAEFSQPDTPVWLCDARGEHAVRQTMSELLPRAFTSFAPEPTEDNK